MIYELRLQVDVVISAIIARLKSNSGNMTVIIVCKRLPLYFARQIFVC